jgi:hypothetical protein
MAFRHLVANRLPENGQSFSRSDLPTEINNEDGIRSSCIEFEIHKTNPY